MASFESKRRSLGAPSLARPPLRGQRGERGLTGPAGSGATGAAGADGAAGATGATGATGAQGATGTQGATGAAGATGSAGATGATGATGGGAPTAGTIHETFSGGTSDSVSSATSNANVGDLGWNTTASGGTTGASIQKQIGASGAIGIVRVQCASSGAGSAVGIYLGSPLQGILHPQDWSECTWRARLSADVVSGQAFVFVGLFDTADLDNLLDGVAFSTSAPAHSDFGFLTEQGGSGAGGRTGVSLDTNWHNFRIVRTSSTRVDFFIDGSPVANTTTHFPTAPLMPLAMCGFGVDGPQGYLEVDDFVLIPL